MAADGQVITNQGTDFLPEYSTGAANISQHLCYCVKREIKLFTLNDVVQRNK